MGDRARRTTITNQKGGVSKTTTAGHIGHGLSLLGRRVLLVDTDPSYNLTQWLCSDLAGATIAEVILNPRRAEEAIAPTRAGNVMILRGSAGLAGAEALIRIDPVKYQDPARMLATLLDHPAIAEQYDDVIIDTPPNLGLIAVNAIVAGEDIVVPELPEPMALMGLVQLLSTVENAVARGLRPAVSPLIVPTLVDKRVDLTDVVLERLGRFGPTLTKTQIPRNVRLSATVGRGITVFDSARRSPGAVAYRKLVREMLDLRESYAASAPALVEA